mmetsp:Transcript_8582/g.28119  ORF Transcript_8582/g.28119 Transcript_8582/m.28119 type:complete len:417 (-) Transcript_8582:203-1453(-)
MRCFLVAAVVARASADGHLCFANENKTFTAMFNPFASSTGYYTFLECGNRTQPTLAMERGVDYTFLQYDDSNWFHPLGFAYYPDGAHRDVDELEPSITASNASTCAESHSCQAPRYFVDGAFVGGTYDNTQGIGGEDFGLDAYEPEFFYPRADWKEKKYEVKLFLNEDEGDYAGDLFYFCHIHNEMSGRIKIVDADGAELNAEETPELGYDYEVPSDFDEACGTFGTEDFRSGAGSCEDTFLCLNGDETDDELHFAQCMHALDCHMEYNMRTLMHESNLVVTFIHQMIPHHENAVNMAKLLLKYEDSAFDDSSESDLEFVDLAWDIINTQNYQISVMEKYLDDHGFARSAVCTKCADSEAWYKRADPSKDCEWVSELSTKRCDVKAEDKTLASEACIEACGQCTNPGVPPVAISRV